MIPLNQNAQNWLNRISFAEGTYRGDQGGRQYNIMFGGGRFDDLSRHPDRVIDGGRYKSAAAGAYQFMPATWSGVMGGAMTPDRQDQAAYLLAKRRGVDINTAPFSRENVALLSPEWASLPTMQGVSYYGQPVKSFESLTNFSNGLVPTSTAQTAAPQESQVNIDPATAIEILRSREKPDTTEVLKDLNKSRIKSGLVKEPEQQTTQVVVAQDDSSDRRFEQELINDYVKSLDRTAETMRTKQSLNDAIISARSAFRGGKSVI